MFKFVFANGSDTEVTIVGDFFDVELVAQERAEAEFIDTAYRNIDVTADTYRTDIRIGMVLSIEGAPYKITEIDIAWDKVKIVTSIRGERYEV